MPTKFSLQNEEFQQEKMMLYECFLFQLFDWSYNYHIYLYKIYKILLIVCQTVMLNLDLFCSFQDVFEEFLAAVSQNICNFIIWRFLWIWIILWKLETIYDWGIIFFWLAYETCFPVNLLNFLLVVRVVMVSQSFVPLS